MENIDQIVLPDFGKKEKKEKEPKKVLVEKTQLSKINRKIDCNFCQTEKILNPAQYQTLFNLHDTEEKLKAEFMCKSCEMEMKRNPILFWAIHGNCFEILAKQVKTVFDDYRSSARSTQDLVNLQTDTMQLMLDSKIKDSSVEFLLTNNLPTGLAIRNVPFVGTVTLNVYETKTNRIIIQ